MKVNNRKFQVIGTAHTLGRTTWSVDDEHLLSLGIFYVVLWRTSTAPEDDSDLYTVG